MRFLPLFFDTSAGVFMLVGSGEPALAKLRLLRAAGAHVRWFSCNVDVAEELATSPGQGQLEISFGDPLKADLSDVVAIVSAAGELLDRQIAARARRQRIPVNVVDCPDLSTFIFPAIVDRGEVVVAIGTGGASPVLAQRLRERIEALLPTRIGELAALIGRHRSRFAAVPRALSPRRFWRNVIAGPIAEAVLAGRAVEAEAELAAAIEAHSGDPRGGDKTETVFVVGAGPGDPDLLTLRALHALADADVVFYDELVTPEILDRIRRDASRVPVGRRVGKPGIGQDAVNKLLIEAAREGKRAVRLKGGDSFVFGRGGEEVDALRKADVSYTIVPGITAGLGAAAQFEVPLTFRSKALRITFLTAHKERDAEAVDWSALTDTKMTVVVYMGMTAAPAVRAGLLAAGRSPQTPVGVFAKVTRPDAQAAVGTLDQLPDLVARIDGGPAILVIGDVVAHSAPWRQPNLSRVIAQLLEPV